jgi:transaldolase
MLKLYNFHYLQKDGMLITTKRLCEHFSDAMELAQDLADEHEWRLMHVEQAAIIGLSLNTRPDHVLPQFISHPYKKNNKKTRL